jgi:hypothetical protein
MVGGRPISILGCTVCGLSGWARHGLGFQEELRVLEQSAGCCYEPAVEARFQQIQVKEDADILKAALRSDFSNHKTHLPHC